MKRSLCRISVVIPMFVLYWMMGNAVNIAILPIGLYLNYSEVKFAYIAVCFVWLSCSPFRKSCCNATWTEILFNTIPVQIYLVCVFAQYHFCISLFLSISVIAIAIGLGLEVWKKLRDGNNTRRIILRYKKAFYQIMILIVSMFFFIPCCLAVFIYKCESPVLVLSEDAWNRICADEEEILAGDGQNLLQEDPYRSNIGLLSCLKKDMWEKYDAEERITVVQKLVDFECDLFNIPRIVVDTKILDPFVLGEYNRTTNKISIDLKHLMNSSTSSEAVIQTIAHETQHAYASYLIANLDFESNPIFQTPYFQEVKSWRDNQEEYIDGSKGDFELYENQPLEVAARTYAEEETKRILSYIEE